MFYWHTIMDIILEFSRFDDSKNLFIQPNLVAFFIIRSVPNILK